MFLLPIISATKGHKLEQSEQIIFPRLTNTVEKSDNEVCRAQSRLYKEHLENLTLWAHEMWDASAKYATGVLRGNVYQMGDWDECITINGPYKTQYCLATLSAEVPEPDPPRDPLSLQYSPFESVLNKIYKTEEISLKSRHAVHMGLCVPASCSSKDLEDSLNEYLLNTQHPLTNKNVTYSAKVQQEMCQTEADGTVFDSWDIGFCFVSLVIILLVLLSTIYDYCQPEEITKKPNEKALYNRLGLVFSIRKNFMDLSKAEESNSALSILYGMKTISIIVIIMDHRFGTFLTGPIINYDYIEQQYRSHHAAFLFHGDLFVDSFFVLSGLLVTYMLLVQFDKRVVNPLFIIFLRYIRLTPLYAFVIFYYASVLNHIGAGPLWKSIIGAESADCRANWWTSLLYISNYVNDKHMCMTHSWYLPCDFHYFIMGVFVILVLNKHKRVGLAILTFLFVLSIVIPFVLTVIYLRPALLQFYPPALKEPKTHPDFRLTYTKTHTRAVSYIIGMFAGYIYYRLKDTPKNLSRFSSHALTAGSLLVIFVSIATGSVFYNRYHEYNAIEAGVYASLHRVAWSAGTVGLLFSASYGHATIIKSVLSWSPWVPLGKLVYGAYLIHMSFQFRSVANTATPKYLTYFDVMCLALGDIVLAFMSALCLHLAIEAPIRKIFKELLTPTRSAKNKLAPEPPAEETTTNNRDNDSRL